jgi:hypothetical protein
MNAQLELLDKPVLSRAAARRNAMESARIRAEQGIANAARRQARLHAEWCHEATEALRRFARSQVGMWTIETARSVIELDLPKPADGRAWGRVVQDAARLGYIQKTTLSAPTVSSNASAKPLWKRGSKA